MLQRIKPRKRHQMRFQRERMLARRLQKLFQHIRQLAVAFAGGHHPSVRFVRVFDVHIPDIRCQPVVCFPHRLPALYKVGRVKHQRHGVTNGAGDILAPRSVVAVDAFFVFMTTQQPGGVRLFRHDGELLHHLRAELRRVLVFRQIKAEHPDAGYPQHMAQLQSLFELCHMRGKIGPNVDFAERRAERLQLKSAVVQPAADLAAVMAIASSYLDKPIAETMAAMGEVGLSGEIRAVSHLEQRLSEAERLGFTQCIIPANHAREIRRPAHMELLPVRNIGQALQLLVKR